MSHFVAVVVAIALLTTACAEPDDTLDAVGGVETTEATQTTMPEEVDVSDDGIGIVEPAVYDCGVEFTDESMLGTPVDGSATGDMVEMFASLGVTVGSPEAWVRLPESTDSVAAFIDPSPLSGAGYPHVYWVRSVELVAGVPTAIAHDGPCYSDTWVSAPEPAQQSAVVRGCSLGEPSPVIGFYTISWDGSGGSEGSLVVLRNGTRVHEFLVGSLTPEQDITNRRIEYGETEGTPIEAVDGPGVLTSEFEPPLDVVLSYEIVIFDGAGGEAARADCGSVVVPSTFPIPECSVVADPLPRVSVGDYLGGRFSIGRNGVDLEVLPFPNSDFIDTGAPTGVPLAYTVTVSSLSEPTISSTGECGTVVVDTATGDLERLESIIASQMPSGPYWYVTIVPICPDCPPAEEITLAFGWVDDGHELTGVWRDRQPSSASGASWERIPLEIPRFLAEQIQNGADVSVEFTADGREVERWTVNGEGAEVVCREATTAPLDIRGDPFCSD